MCTIPKLLLALFTVFSCSNFDQIPYSYEIPETLSDEIVPGSITGAGMDTTHIYSAVRKIKSGALGKIHSFLIYKDGQLVLEEYFPGHSYKWEAGNYQDTLVNWNVDAFHSVMSVTKSITSTCVGIAIDHGFITSVNETIFNYLPDHQHLRTPDNEKITIEHLLTMSSGYDWIEWGRNYKDTENPIIGIWYSEKDPVSFILEGKFTQTPGSKFSYFGGNQIILGEIIKNASGMRIDTFSERYLFAPLSIDSVQWSLEFEQGVIEAAGGLIMKPRDMLKVGILFLNEGNWNNESVLSKEWIQVSTARYFDGNPIRIPGEDTGRVSYGYSWWIKTLHLDGQAIDTYLASGWGGQKIVVIPDHGMIIVFTGGNYTSGNRQFGIIKDYIIPAIH